MDVWSPTWVNSAEVDPDPPFLDLDLVVAMVTVAVYTSSIVHRLVLATFYMVED